MKKYLLTVARFHPHCSKEYSYETVETELSPKEYLIQENKEAASHNNERWRDSDEYYFVTLINCIVLE